MAQLTFISPIHPTDSPVVFQSLHVVSSLPVAITDPSSLTAKQLTAEVWSSRVCSRCVSATWLLRMDAPQPIVS